MHQNHANQLSFKEYLKASDVTFSLCNAGAIYAVGSIANRATHNTSFESRPMTYFATRVRLVGRIECASSRGCCEGADSIGAVCLDCALAARTTCGRLTESSLLFADTVQGVR